MLIANIIRKYMGVSIFFSTYWIVIAISNFKRKIKNKFMCETENASWCQIEWHLSLIHNHLAKRSMKLQRARTEHQWLHLHPFPQDFFCIHQRLHWVEKEGIEVAPISWGWWLVPVSMTVHLSSEQLNTLYDLWYSQILFLSLHFYEFHQFLDFHANALASMLIFCNIGQNCVFVMFSTTLFVVLSKWVDKIVKTLYVCVFICVCQNCVFLMFQIVK